jgi:hypothetical protein
MNIRRRSLTVIALAVMVSLPLLGISGVASAKVKAKGCHKTHTCQSGGETGTGATAPGPMTIQVDPNPLVETSSSAIAAVVQVETSPSLAGDIVDISSSQLAATCADFTGFFKVGALPVLVTGGAALVIPVTLDDEGNASVGLVGSNCAPGSSAVEADLSVAPYYTAQATLDALPPTVTTSGVFGYPTSSGIVAGGEVETGDTGPAADQSDIYAVFYVETDPVYAEQTVQMSLNQLQSRCLAGEGFGWLPPSGGTDFETQKPGVQVPIPPIPLDDDGNAVFLFEGASCAAGSSVVTADVDAGTHPTYTTTFNIVAPQPTI